MKTLSKEDKDKLILSIDWDKSFDDLSWDEKANLGSLHNLPFLNEEVKPVWVKHFESDKRIIEHRGKERLYLYL